MKMALSSSIELMFLRYSFQCFGCRRDTEKEVEEKVEEKEEEVVRVGEACEPVVTRRPMCMRFIKTMNLPMLCDKLRTYFAFTGFCCHLHARSSFCFCFCSVRTFNTTNILSSTAF